MANNVTITGIKYGTTTITASFTDGGVTKTASVENFQVTAIAPSLSFTATSGTLTYTGSGQVIGKVSYNGDGTAYYYIQKATSQPSTPAASASGWVQITSWTRTSGGTKQLDLSQTNAGTYYVFLKATGASGGNYTGVDPKQGGNKAIGIRTVNIKTTPTYVSTALTYNGSNNSNGTTQTLINAGACSAGGTMYYYVSTSSTAPTWNNGSGWTTTLPTGINANNYYVWYYCYVSDTNNNSAGTNVSSVKALADGPKTIARAKTATAYDIKGLVYNGTTEDNSTAIAQTGVGGQHVTWGGTTSAKNAGSYSASATPESNFAWSGGGTSASTVEWSIARRGQTKPVLQGAETTYPTTASASVKTAGTVANGTAAAPGTLTWSNQSRSTAGSQTATAYYAATTTNFEASPVSDGVTVKVNVRSVSITAPTFTQGTLTYTGSGQVIMNAGSCTPGGTMYYYISNSSTKPSFSTASGSGWTTTAPTERTNAGTYYVWYYCYVSDTTNNSGSGINTVTAVSGDSRVINKKAVTVTAGSDSKTYNGVALTKNSASLSGQVSGHTLGTVTVSGSQTNAGSSANVASGAHILSGSTDVTNNYQISYANGTLRVDPANLTVNEVNYNGTWDGASHSSSITVAVASPCVWDGKTIVKGSSTSYGTTVTSAGEANTAYALISASAYTASTTVYYKVTGGTNYNDYEDSVTFSISKANATLPKTIVGDSVSAGNVSYHNVARATVTKDYTGGTLQYATSTNGTTYGAWNTVTWYDGNLTANPSLSTKGNLYVKFRVLGDANHNNSSESIAVTLTVYAASDANMVVDIVTSTLTYNGTTCSNGTAQTIATVDTSNNSKYHGVGSYSIGYKKGSQASAENQVTWVTSTPLTATDAGTYYVYYTFGHDGNHSNSKPWSSHADNYVGSVTINPKAGSLTASAVNTTYNGTSGNNGSAQTLASGVSSTGTYYFGFGSSTTVAPTSWGSANALPSQTNAGTYYIWAKCDASSNGNCASVAAKYIGTAVISPKTPTVTYSADLAPISEFCTTEAKVSTTWERTSYYPAIASASASGNGTGAITYSINQTNWTVSSDGKTISIPSTATATGTTSMTKEYTVTVTATQAANGNWGQGSASQTFKVTLKANALDRIALTLASKTIPFNGTTTGSVVAIYTNGEPKDVTSSATYSSDPTGIVTITK